MAATNNTSTQTIISSSGGSSTADLVVPIVAIVVCGVVVISVATLIYKCKMRRRRQSSTPAPREDPPAPSPTVAAAVDMYSTTGMTSFLDGIIRERPIRFTPEQLDAFTGGYKHRIGAGGFGVVYKGFFPDGIPIAVKVLHRASEQQFMAEVSTIGRTYHANLVRLYGFCFAAAAKALVYEFMDNNSLEAHLFSSAGGSALSFDKLHSIGVGTAKALRYLHEECERRIIHYDIKPGNVLLTASFVPKVADFGLARLCDAGDTHVSLTGGGIRGTPGYAAPELWLPFPVTHKCDVYSFGMMLFEIVGRRRNLQLRSTVAAASAAAEDWYPRWVWRKMEAGEAAEVASVAGDERALKVCRVALWCVQQSPERRPEMSAVVRMLEGDDDVAMPPNPFAYMDSNLNLNSNLDSKYSESWTKTTTATSSSGGDSGSAAYLLANVR